MPVTCEDRWAAHTACACAALSSSAAACAAVSSSAAAPFAPTSELEEAGAVTCRPVLLAEALPFGAVLAALGAGAFLAAGAAKLAAGLPKSVSCGMGLEPRATAAAKRAAASAQGDGSTRKDRVHSGVVVARSAFLSPASYRVEEPATVSVAPRLSSQSSSPSRLTGSPQ